MIKSLTALAIFGLLGAAVVVLPGFAPRVEAGETVALAKADRLDTRPVFRNCSQQVWPNFEASCLRNGQSGALIQEVARLVTAPAK
jgi:hypothetical protein